MSVKSPPRVSVVIPAYNEEAGIAQTLQELTQHPRVAEFELIVVNDGSTDRTAEEVERFPDVRLIHHAGNRGYGATVKTGIKASTGDYVLWYDADGQHRVEDLLSVVDALVQHNLDYCIGVRDARSHSVMSRSLGKLILRWVVSLVAGEPIKDFNSGLRGFKRSVILPYLHLFPAGFGASTTTTVLMIERNHVGGDVPITVRKRLGKSSVKQFRDGIRTLLIILRLVLLFKPLLFWGTIGFTLITGGMTYGIIEAITEGLGFPVLGALVVILGVQTFFFGLLSDQVSQVRREKFE